MLSRVVSMNKNLRPRVASRLTPILKLTLQPRGSQPVARSLAFFHRPLFPPSLFLSLSRQDITLYRTQASRRRVMVRNQRWLKLVLIFARVPTALAHSPLGHLQLHPRAIEAGIRGHGSATRSLRHALSRANMFLLLPDKPPPPPPSLHHHGYTRIYNPRRVGSVSRARNGAATFRQFNAVL